MIAAAILEEQVMIIKLAGIPFIKKLYILFVSLCSMMPDEMYLRMIYRIRTGKKLNLKNPRSFNEKIQWLKLHGDNASKTVLVDKYSVRQYIASKIGEEYLIPLLGIYNNAEEINVEQLPKEFVIKCTHDSGSVILYRGGGITPELKKQLNRALKRKYYLASREYYYKGVRPRIIIEKMMKNEDGSGLIDYKFYCFHGEPKFLYVSSDLHDHSQAHISFYNMDLSDAAFQRKDYKHFDHLPKIPKNYDKMVKMAKDLSKDFPFVRVDLYEINEKIYFSEMTFSPCGGMMPFEPQQYDEILGSYINLNDLEKK